MKTESLLRLLNGEEMGSIHSFAIKIMSSIGVEVRHERAVSLLRAGGCAVNEKGRVTMPENIAEEVIKKVMGRKPKLYDRGSGKEVELDGDPFIKPGPVKLPRLMAGNEGCLFVLDVGADERRSATLDDIGKAALMADALENVKVLGIPMTPIDAPLETRELHSLIQLISNTGKPILFGGVPTNTHTLKTAKYTVEVIKALHRGEEGMKRPNVDVLLEAVSPLKYDTCELDFIMACAEMGVTTYHVASMPVLGITGPMSIPASIAQSIAEIIPGSYLIQLIDPELNVSMSMDIIPCDARTLHHVYGSAETTIVGLAETQLLREFYGMQIWGGRSFRSDAKFPGIQAAFEKGVTATLALLAGASGFGNGGVIDGDMLFSFDQLVIDDEFISLLKPIAKGIEVCEDDFNLQILEEAIDKDYHFLADKMTLKRLRETVYTSKLFDRGRYQDWFVQGRKTVRSKAMMRAQEILKEHRPEKVDVDMVKRLRLIVEKADKDC